MQAYGVFEGGGAKGFCHIGALKAAEDRGIEFVAFAGTSIGAIVASLAAAGYTANELYGLRDGSPEGPITNELFQQLDADQQILWEQFSKGISTLSNSLAVPHGARPRNRLKTAVSLFIGWALAHRLAWTNRQIVGSIWAQHGVHDTARVADWLDKFLRAKLGLRGSGPVTFSQLPKPLRVVATDITNGDIAVFGGQEDGHTPVAQAVMASATFPFFFQPSVVGSRRFVDGGVLSNLPAWVLDDLRLVAADPLPTFGFRLVDPPVPRPISTQDSFPTFALSLANAWLSGGKQLETRGIDDCHVVELRTDISILAFEDLKSRAPELFKVGYETSTQFFDRELGPREPEMMRTVLRIIANHFKAEIEARSERGLTVRASIALSVGDDLARVSYSSHRDADDRLRIWKSSNGPGSCFTIKEPVVAKISDIAPPILRHPHFKLEHALRPKGVEVVYSIPIFREPTDWYLTPAGRAVPIAVLVFDVDRPVDQILHNPGLQDRFATYAQIAGIYLTGKKELLPPGLLDEESGLSQLPARPTQIAPGFWVSSRKPRWMVSGPETSGLQDRIISETRP